MFQFIKKLIQKLMTIIIGFLFCFTIALILFYQSNIPQDFIKSLIEYELKKTFSDQISIEKIQGNLLTSIELINVKINNQKNYDNPYLLSVKNIKINYNMFYLLGRKGKILNSINGITINSPILYLERNKQGLFNTDSIKNKFKKGPKKTPLDYFDGHAAIQNLTIYYSDKKGWNKKLKHEPFYETFKQVNGQAKVKNGLYKFELVGKIENTLAPIKLSGSYNSKIKKYLVNYIFLKVHSNSWGQYIIPLKGFAFLNDTFSIHGNIRSKHDLNSEKLPFWYNVYIKTHQTTIKTPFLESPLFNTKGMIHIYNATLTKSELKKQLPKKEYKNIDKIYKELQEKGIISNQGYISNTISKNIKTTHGNKKKDWVMALLKSPPHNIDFTHVKSKYNHSDFNFKGSLSISKKNLNLSFKIINIPLQLFLKDKNQIRGHAKGTLSLKGSLKNPKFKGVLHSKDINIWGIPIKNSKVYYEGYHKNINYHIKEATVYDAKTKGSGTLSFGQTPHFEAHYFTKDIMVKKIPELSKINIKGTSNITTTIKATQKSINIDIQSNASHLKLEKQLINTFHITLETNKSTIKKIVATANINNSKNTIALSGYEKNGTIEINTSANNILFTDLSEKDSESLKGLISFKSHLSFPKSIVIQKMIKESHITASVTLKNYHFYDQPFKTINFKIQKEKNIIHIKQFEAKANNQSLSFQGHLNNYIPVNFNVDIANLKLKKARWFTTFIPQTLWPLDGTLTLQAKITQKKPSTTLEKNNFMVTTNIEVQDAIVRNQPFKKILLDANWNGSILKINQASLLQENSQLKFTGLISKKGELNININKETSLQLEEFNPILSNIGHFEGKMKINGFIKNTIQKPHLKLNFEGTNLATTYTKINKISGLISLKENILKIHHLQFKKNLSKILVKGTINGQNGWATQDTNIDLKLDINQVNIHTLINLLHQIQTDLNAFSGIHKKITPEKIPNTNFKSNRSSSFYIESQKQKSKKKILFSTNKKNTILNQFQLIKEKSILIKKTDIIKSSKNIQGIVTGKLSVISKKNTPLLLEGHLTMKECQFLFLKSNRIEIDIKPKMNELNYNIIINNGYFGENKFEKIEWIGKVDKYHYLHIEKSEITTKKNPKINLIKGQIPLEPIWNKSIKDAPIDLDLHLKDNQLTALSIFHNNVESMSNTGLLHVKMNGTLKNPMLNSDTFHLENTKIKLKNKTEINIPKAKLSIKSNKIETNKTLVNWTQFTKSQKKIENGIYTSGSIKITELNLLNPNSFKLYVDLLFFKNTLKINKPNLYIGDLKIQDVSLIGELDIPFSKKEKLNFLENIRNGYEKGPTLKGNIKLNNGTLLIPKKTIMYPAINMDLNLTLQQDLFINGSILGEGAFAGLTTDFELKEANQSLKISGTLNNPKVENDIVLKDGSLNILNNEFILLKINEQKRYVTLSQSQQQKNSIAFSNQQTKKKASELIVKPFISALAIVQQINFNEIISSENRVENTYSHIFIQINDPIQDIGILYFDIFESNHDYVNPPDLKWIKRYSLNIGSNQHLFDESTNFELISTLMPELNKEDSASSEILTKFGEKRVNLLVRKGFLRPLEKQLAKSIGLYDLKIDYNLGSELLQTNTNQTNFLGLNLMQQLVVNQLYLKVRTNLDINSSEQASQSFEISEIELQYYLLKNLSINYANLKDPFTQNSYRPKLSLRFNHEF